MPVTIQPATLKYKNQNGSYQNADCLKGDKGDTGNTGVTPDFQIGTVQTGAAGSSAAASISGTAEQPVLNLTIPQGVKGDPGDDGVSPSVTVSKTGRVATIEVTDGSGTTSVDIEDGTATDAQVDDAVSDWLDDHPEATTTVQDGSITRVKLHDDLKADIDGKAPAINVTTDKKYTFSSSELDGLNDFTLNIEKPTGVSKEYIAKGHDILPKTDAATNDLYAKAKDSNSIILNGINTSDNVLYYARVNNVSTITPLENISENDVIRIIGTFIGTMTNNGSGSSGPIKITLKINYNDNTTENANASIAGDGTYTVVSITAAKTVTSIESNIMFRKNWTFNGTVRFAVTRNAAFVETAMPSDLELDQDDVGTNGITILPADGSITYIADTKKYIDDNVPDNMLTNEDLIYLSPEMFGAIGDGIEDDSQALLECISEAVLKNKAIRGYGRYKTSETLVLDCRNFDVFIREINYIGNYNAVEIRNMYVKFDFHRIQSSNNGIVFGKKTDDTKYASYCRVTGNEIQSYGDCIYIEQYTYYNTVDIRYLNSSNGNCINAQNRSQGEYVFRSSACKCPNGYVGINLNDSKLYDFCIEGDCRYGLLNPTGCSCNGFRHREQVDKMRNRIFHSEENNNGPLITFTVPVNHDGTRGFRYVSIDALPWYAIDMSAIQSYEDIEQSSGTNVWVSNAYSGIELGTPIRANEVNARPCIGEKMYFISNYKVCSPEWKMPVSIDQASIDFTLFDGASDSDIYAADQLRKYIGTDMIINISHSDIYFNSYFGAIGYNEITITQTSGNTCTVYDKLGNVIFDGTNSGNGTWKLKCVMNRNSLGRYKGTVSELWVYDGTNEIWEIEKL